MSAPAPATNDETIAQTLESNNPNNENEEKGIVFGLLKWISLPLFILGQKKKFHQNVLSERKIKILFSFKLLGVVYLLCLGGGGYTWNFIVLFRKSSLFRNKIIKRALVFKYCPKIFFYPKLLLILMCAASHRLRTTVLTSNNPVQNPISKISALGQSETDIQLLTSLTAPKGCFFCLFNSIWHLTKGLEAFKPFLTLLDFNILLCIFQDSIWTLFNLYRHFWTSFRTFVHYQAFLTFSILYFVSFHYLKLIN